MFGNIIYSRRRKGPRQNGHGRETQRERTQEIELSPHSWLFEMALHYSTWQFASYYFPHAFILRSFGRFSLPSYLLSFRCGLLAWQAATTHCREALRSKRNCLVRQQIGFFAIRESNMRLMPGIRSVQCEFSHNNLSHRQQMRMSSGLGHRLQWRNPRMCDDGRQSIRKVSKNRKTVRNESLRYAIRMRMHSRIERALR